MKDLRLVYDILAAIYRGGAYGARELGEKLESAESPRAVTKLVYGVLERDTELEYYIGKLAEKRPKPAVTVLLKMGLYCLDYIDGMPDYAIVNETVELCAEIGKRELKGFVNGVLKRFLTARPALPSAPDKALSVTSSTPLWLVKRYIAEYGYESAARFLSAGVCDKEHIRPNLRHLDASRLDALLTVRNIPHTADDAGGFYVTNDKRVRALFNEGKITFQSYTSMQCCYFADVRRGERVLDLCAAPGGKSVFLSELAKEVVITACDVHQHRAALIEQYIKRMGAEWIGVRVLDATVFQEDFAGKFDLVLCDVPCSGLGVAAKKPDIYLGMTADKITALARLQRAILERASAYAAPAGRVVYSTCTLLREENESVVFDFLTAHGDWEMTNERKFFPDGAGTDGFYMAMLRRKERS